MVPSLESLPNILVILVGKCQVKMSTCISYPSWNVFETIF